MNIITTKAMQYLGKSRSIQRNALLSLINQSVSIAAALVSIPLLLKYLGNERLGLLTIVWVIVGYFSVLDLGLSVAMTRSIAHAIGLDQKKNIPGIFWSGILAQFILGIIGCVLIILTLPFMIGLLNIDPLYIREAQYSFMMCAIAFPLILTSSSLVGLLQAAQRFDLTVKVQIPASVLQYLIPIAVAAWQPQLQYVVLSLILTRILASFFLLYFSRRVFPDLMKSCSFRFKEFKELLKFGGWVTVGNLITPIILYSDRFIIGSLLSMASLVYYSVPNEAVIKLTFIPGSIVAALFPAFSSLSGMMDYKRINDISSRAIKVILIIMGMLVLIMFLFSHEIITIWIGSEFSNHSSTIFRILLIGMLINSVARVYYSQIQAMGAAELTAIIQLIELPLQLALSYFLVMKWGLVGAAISWTARLTFDCLMLLFFSRRLMAKRLCA